MKRRDFLRMSVAGMTGLAGQGIADATGPGEKALTGQPRELYYQSATRLAEMIRRKEVSSEEVVRAHLERIRAVNPKINAVFQIHEDLMRAQAREADRDLARGIFRGPLHGVPVTIKDEFKTRGIKTTIGTLGLKDYVPQEDATVVRRYREAGAIILGKTNVPELLWAFGTDNWIYGPSKNPYDLAYSPGGSSGGEAAIIAAGGSPLGVGSDAGGSIRVPAHDCGIAGLKPTWGRIPVTGSLMPRLPFLSRLNAVGPLARFVEDLALGLVVLSGPDGEDPDCPPVPVRDPRGVDIKKLRIAFFSRDKLTAPIPVIQETVIKAARSLERLGAKVEEKCPPGFAEVGECAALGTEDFESLRSFLKACNTTKISPLLEAAFAFNDQVLKKTRNNRTGAWKRQNQWRRFRQDLLGFFGRYDILLCPPNMEPASKLVQPGREFNIEFINFAGFEWSWAFNLSGSPAAVVRCGVTEDCLPVGVQVVGPHWREDLVLAVGGYLEKELGGWQPPGL